LIENEDDLQMIDNNLFAEYEQLESYNMTELDFLAKKAEH
jgi:hypothetical protein